MQHLRSGLRTFKGWLCGFYLRAQSEDTLLGFERHRANFDLVSLAALPSNIGRIKKNEPTLSKREG